MKLHRSGKIIILVLLIALMTGCAPTTTGQESSSDEGITIRWMIYGERSKSSDGVIARFNSMLKEYYPDTTVEFEIVPMELYQEKWAMIMAANETLDIVWLGNEMFNYTEEVKKGSFMALDYLLNTSGGDLMSAIPDELWQRQKRDGKIYGIPLKGALYRKDYAVVVSKSHLDDYGDAQHMKQVNQGSRYSTAECYESFEPLLAALKEQRKLGTGLSCDTFKDIAGKGYEGIYGSDSPFVIKIFDEKLKVYNKYELESYRSYFQKMDEWYQKGYIRDDIEEVLAPENDNGTRNGNALFLDEYGEDGVVLDAIGTEYEAVRLPLQDYKYIAYESGRNVLAIPRTTENPQRAMEIINLLNSEKGAGLARLLCNGLEGRHYVKKGENLIDRVTDDSGKPVYALSPYAVGDLFLNLENTKGEFDRLHQYNEQAIVSPLVGFELDTRMIVVEMTKIDLIAEEYLGRLERGTAENWEEDYRDMIARMKEAGADKVIGEMQRQLELFQE